jgi:vancomycin permeability regulator SanA
VQPSGPLSDVTKERLDKAIELYKEGLFKTIYLVGSNQGNRRGPLGLIKYFIKAGIPAQALVELSSGTDVDESAEIFGKACATHHFKTVTLITHYYGMTRAKLALRHYGIQEIRQEHAGHLAISDLRVIARDFAAFLIYETEYEWDSFMKKVPSAVDELESTIGSPRTCLKYAVT